MPECPKCRTGNNDQADVCAACGAHLYVSCRACGAQNPRAKSRCSDCGHRLHRSRWRRWRSRLTFGGKRVRALEVVLVLIALFLVYHYVSSGSGPSWGGGE